MYVAIIISLELGQMLSIVIERKVSLKKLKKPSVNMLS